MAQALARTWCSCVLALGLSGCGFDLSAAGSDHVRSSAGGYVLAAPPPGMTVRIGSKQLMSEADAAAAGRPCVG